MGQTLSEPVVEKVRYCPDRVHHPQERAWSLEAN